MNDYRYRKLEPGQKYEPARPPPVIFKRSVLGEHMLILLGQLFA